MDPTPLATSTLAIQIHAGAAILALVLGTVVMLGRKGDRWHKFIGRVWVVTMLVVALSSFLVTEIEMFGPYSVIHILSILTLYWLGDAVWKIRRGDVAGHKRAMVSLYAGALVIAGAFTLAPGRRMNEVLFADGGTSALALGLAVAILVSGILIYRRYGRRGHAPGVANPRRAPRPHAPRRA